ncbi:MAG: lysophospholipid acyltransferase family protein [Myxococcota bacterium]
MRSVPSVPHRDSAWIAGLVAVSRPLLERWFKPEVRGLSRIPEGPALYVGNHSGGFMTPDTWIFTSAVFERRGIGDVPYGLTHDTVMRWPGVRRLLDHLGGVHANAANAHRLFAQGAKVLVYPGGDLDAFRPSRDRDRVVFGKRRGYVRLALREGVPVVPVVSAGSHEGWYVLDDGRWIARLLPVHRLLRTDVVPITLSIPWGLTPAPPAYLPWPTRVLIEVLEPIRFDRSGEAAASDDEYVEQCHRRVHGAMQAALARLAEERRQRIREERRARRRLH